jgi:gliding motility-associated-like protein
MKVSPNGKILANTNHELKNVELFCIQDNPFDIKYIGTINKFSQKLIHVYGCEFSSDNTKLYFTSGNYLFQADLSSLNIDTINKSLYELYGPLNLDSNQFTCPQLGPDKKIYIKEGYYGNISIIKSPNLTASNCQFQFNGLSIPNCDYYGNLPYFQTYYLNEDTLFQMTFPCKDPEDTSYFEMPDVFTPNGDGMNDTLSLYFKNISDFYLNIYNRWGELVFESKIPDFKWDGTFNGQKCAEGSYYAIFNYTSYKKEAKSKKIIQLIR